MPSIKALRVDLEHRFSHIRLHFLSDFFEIFGKWFPNTFRNLVLRHIKPNPVVFRSRLNAQSTSAFSSILEMWRDGVALRERGFYRLGLDLQKEALTECYGVHGFNNRAHAPSILSPWFASNIGHIGFLALLLRCQESGILHEGRRALVPIKIANMPAIHALSHLVSLAKVKNSAINLSVRNGNVPVIWPYVQGLEIIQTKTGFEDIISLWENYWVRPEQHQANPFVLDEAYLEESERQFRELGIDSDQRIVGLHIREKPGVPDDQRVAPIKSYLKAIRYLVDKGYKVIRFGEDSMSRFPEIPGVLDLVHAKEDQRLLHLYLLSRSRFLLSTMSGPSALAINMGLPTLITNAIAIGRNSLRGPPGTSCIPKHYFHQESGQELTLSELLGSPVGYSDLPFPKKMGMPISRPNTSEEILKATRDMVDLDQHDFRDDFEPSEVVDQIRFNHDAFTYGHISPSFLGDNPKWAN